MNRSGCIARPTRSQMHHQAIRRKASPAVRTRLQVGHKLTKLRIVLLLRTLPRFVAAPVYRVRVTRRLSACGRIGRRPLCQALRVALRNVNRNRCRAELLSAQVAHGQNRSLAGWTGGGVGGTCATRWIGALCVQQRRLRWRRGGEGGAHTGRQGGAHDGGSADVAAAGTGKAAACMLHRTRCTMYLYITILLYMQDNHHTPETNKCERRYIYII